MSRTIFAGVLVAALTVALGCGSKSEPTLPPVNGNEAPSPTPPTNTDPKGGPPKADPPKVAAWEFDQTKHAIPAAPVKGSIAGAEVTPEVVIEGAELTFRVLKAGTQTVERSLKLNLAPMLVAGQPVPKVLERSWAVKIDADAGAAVPEVWREVAGKDPHIYPSGYALTLELGPRKDGKVAGKIYLSLGDAEKSFLAGAFDATYVRPHTERPGPDDAPYIAGEVNVTGAKADAEVRVSYVAFGADGKVFFKELQLPFDPVPEQQARWTRDESDKPRVGTFVAGDGKGRPFRYEFVKLPPGRYLLATAVTSPPGAAVAERGPAAWKWVDLPTGGTLTENLTLDATKTGSVEVSVPADVKGKVYFAPADAPDKAPVPLDLFVAVAFQSVRQDADIAGGKALVKNLAPGKYEVRAGDLRGFVDVIASKTVEFSLTPPKK